MNSSEERERLRRLMMAALDGELEDGERAQLEEALERDPDLRAELERMREVRQVTREMTWREPPPEVWQEYWGSVYARLERATGWVLVSLGTLVLAGWGLWRLLREIWSEAALPMWVKLALFSLLLGLVVLLVSVVREKWVLGRRDPYRGVER